MKVENGKATILVVDDEQDVLRMLGKFLRGEGFEVIEAEDPRDALAMCSTPQPEIDLVLSDYKMPHMSGLDLGLALRTIRPDLPIVFMSGNVEAEGLLIANGFRCLRKPFDFPEMVITLHDVLALRF